MISLGSVIFFSSARISFPINPIGLTFSISSHSLGRVESAARERIDAAGYSGVDVNGDNVRFLDALRESYGGYAQEVIICGLMSCRGDAYNPAEALGVDEALEFHAWQAGRLAGTRVDFLPPFPPSARRPALLWPLQPPPRHTCSVSLSVRKEPCWTARP